MTNNTTHTAGTDGIPGGIPFDPIFVVFPTLGFFTTTLNFVVIVIIAKKHLVTQDNKFLFILLLSVTDFLIGAFEVSLIAFNFIHDSAVYFSFGIVQICVFYAMETGTIISVLGLSVNQYIALTYPLRYFDIVDIKTLKLAGFVGVVIWLLDSVLGITLTVVYFGNEAYLHFNIFVAVWHIIIPIIVVTAIQTKVLRIAYEHHVKMKMRLGAVKSGNRDRQRNRDGEGKAATGRGSTEGQNGDGEDRGNDVLKVETNPPAPTSPEDTHQPFRGAITVSILLSVLIICWLPKAVINILAVVLSLDLTTYFYYTSYVSNLFFMFNSFVNPFVYAFRITPIRRELIKFFHRSF